MVDIIEYLEAGAEARYDRMAQPGGKLKCGCGKIFDPEKEGGVPSPNPYAMPVCGDCFEKCLEDVKMEEILRDIRKERDRQDKQWGEAGHDDQHRQEDWTEYITGFANAERGAALDFRARMVSVAALAVAAIQSHDRKPEAG